MKSSISCIYFFLCVLLQVSAQPNDAGTLNDLGRININVYIPADSLLIDENIKGSEYAYLERTLTHKLRSFIAKNGFSGTNRSPRFMLFPTIIVTDRVYTATAPSMVVQKMEVSLYLADYIDQKTFDVVTFNIQGTGRTKEQAVRKALNRIRYSSKVEDFLAQGKKKILTYYNDQCDFIKKEVEMLGSTHRYKEAFDLLLQIPQASKDCYEQALVMIPEYYKKLARRECQQLMQKARVSWASKSKTYVLDREQDSQEGVTGDAISDRFKNENKVDTTKTASSSLSAKETRKIVYEALTYLDAILPDSECYEDANQLREEIKLQVNDNEFFEKRKKYEDSKEITAAKIKAMSEIARASMQHDFEEQAGAAIQQLNNN